MRALRLLVGRHGHQREHGHAERGQDNGESGTAIHGAIFPGR